MSSTQLMRFERSHQQKKTELQKDSAIRITAVITIQKRITESVSICFTPFRILIPLDKPLSV